MWAADLGDARILGTREALETFEQFRPWRCRRASQADRRQYRRSLSLCGTMPTRRTLSPAAAIARGGGGADGGVERDVVGVGEGPGLLAADRAHAHALLDVEAART